MDKSLYYLYIDYLRYKDRAWESYFRNNCYEITGKHIEDKYSIFFYKLRPKN